MYQKQHHQQQACTLLYTYMCRVLFFFMGCCPILYVRTWYVSRDPGSYIVRAYLVSYCLSVRQQQRFDHPTLKPTSVLFLGCIKNSTISSKHVHCCIHMSHGFTPTPQRHYFAKTIHATFLYPFSMQWWCVHAVVVITCAWCVETKKNKNIQTGDNLHGHVDKKKGKHKN